MQSLLKDRNIKTLPTVYKNKAIYFISNSDENSNYLLDLLHKKNDLPTTYQNKANSLTDQTSLHEQQKSFKQIEPPWYSSYNTILFKEWQQYPTSSTKQSTASIGRKVRIHSTRKILRKRNTLLLRTRTPGTQNHLRSNTFTAYAQT